MIATVEFRAEMIRRGRITQSPVEVDDVIEVACFAYPPVDALSVSLVLFIWAIGDCAGEGQYSRADNTQAMLMRAVDDLRICLRQTLDQFVMHRRGNRPVAGKGAEIVDTLKHNQRSYVGLSENVAIKAS